MGQTMTTSTAQMKAAGFVCRYGTIEGQGYLGGDGVRCYRVYSPEGVLMLSRASTPQTARAAWAEAARWLAKGCLVQGAPAIVDDAHA